MRCAAGCAGVLLFGQMAFAQEAPPAVAPANPGDDLAATVRKLEQDQAAQLREMQREIASQDRRLREQDKQIAQMKHLLAAEQRDYQSWRTAVDAGVLAQQRAGDVRAGGALAGAQPMPAPDAPAPSSSAPVAAAETADAQDGAQQRPVGRAPESDERPPEVAPIFSEPGVLTPQGKFVIEPSYQFAYSSSERVAIIGYTIIPALLIGLIDARQVKITTQTAALAMRYGLTSRLEVELRVPYVAAHTDTISREIFTGSATDRVFSASGNGLGDVEGTVRYQFNNGGADHAYYIGWLRFKSRTGRDPFEVTTDCVQRCIQNTTGTGLPLQLPTGSGFYAIQPGMTWLYPSDPVVFFGNLSYMHNFPRDNVDRRLVGGVEEHLGKVEVGDIYDASIGMGLALNDKASISIGYDQSFLGVTRQNGQTVAGSSRSVLGSLLLGGSYRFSDTRTLNFALGVGVTRDTPDVTVTVRMPITL
jgi:hypothetical protein